MDFSDVTWFYSSSGLDMVRWRVGGQEGCERRDLLAPQPQLQHPGAACPGGAVLEVFVQLLDGPGRAHPQAVGRAHPPGHRGDRYRRVPSAFGAAVEVELLPG